MHLDHLVGNFEKRKKKTDLVYIVGQPAGEDRIKETEKRLGVVFPYQVRLFYSSFDGLWVADPPLEIFGLDALARQDNLIPFSLVDGKIEVAFDCSRINRVDQWDIVNCHDGYVITHTFANYWTNKMFAWIDNRRPIWKKWGT